MKTHKSQISILGCGWLGLPLAGELISKGFKVKGSTTSEGKLRILRENHIEPFLISLSEEESSGDLNGFLDDSVILIIDIPPKLRGENKENFVVKMKILMPFVEQSSIEKVLFISSTSVYADDNSMVTETTVPQPETEGGKQLLEAEQLFRNSIHFKTTILRFGGLIGPDRHPIKFIAGRENLENPEGAVNLIHQNDCIGIIKSIIEQNCWSETFNAVFPKHPTREKYYAQKATELDLPLPKFAHDKPSMGKVISSYKIENTLGYQFKTTL